MPNTQIEGHPLIGTTHTYHADLPAYDPDLDIEGGTLILANGFPVTIKAAFFRWNGIPGLDMLYVFVPATGCHTHVPPRALSLGVLTETGHTGERQFDCETEPYALSDCAWWDMPSTSRPEWAQFDCWGRVGKVGDGQHSALCEGHHNRERPH